MAFFHTPGWSPPSGIVKAIGGTGSRLGAMAVMFSGPESRDLHGEWFSARTDFSGSDDAPVVLVNHGNPIDLGLEAFGLLSLGQARLKHRTDGIFAEFELDSGDPGVNDAIRELIHAGAFRWSSGSRADLVERKSSGEILRWPIFEVSLAPQPAEPRLPKVQEL